MSTHSPAPWTAARCKCGHCSDINILMPQELHRDKPVLATVGSDDSEPSDEDWANAHLIAAAPELSDALQAIVVQYSNLSLEPDDPAMKIREQYWGTVMRKAAAALNKARGVA